jgi:hypothetical protein
MYFALLQVLKQGGQSLVSALQEVYIIMGKVDPPTGSGNSFIP